LPTTAAAQLPIICLPYLNRLFDSAPLTLAEPDACLRIDSIVLVLAELEKLVGCRRA
jgi:hypothetical protein